MDIDYLSQLPVDVFIQQITYLPFDSVANICQTNIKLHNYCSDIKYNNNWKKLIDDTFGNVYDYQNKLVQIRSKLGINEGVYNYLVYSHLVKLLDPITQLMIYYRQGDMKSFDNPNYNDTQRFLALFLLNKKNEMMDYLPSDAYLPFISMLGGDKMDQNILNKMLIKMTKEGSLKGVSMMVSKGANILARNDVALRWASKNGHLEIVKYLVEQGADIHTQIDVNDALIKAILNGHLEVVRYLIEHGADIHAQNDSALRWASHNGHLEVVKHLVEHGADVHAEDDHALRLASEHGHLDIVKYLTEHGADVHAENDDALKEAREWGHLEVVKYLESASKNK